MVRALQIRAEIIARGYLSGDIDSKEEALEQFELFVDDYFRSHPRLAEDTTEWDFENILDNYINNEIQRWTL